jgi:hypothetical protein
VDDGGVEQVGEQGRVHDGFGCEIERATYRLGGGEPIGVGDIGGVEYLESQSWEIGDRRYGAGADEPAGE